MSKNIDKNNELKNLANFADDVKFNKIRDIMIATYNKDKHIMLLEREFDALQKVYAELSDLERVDLEDYMKNEKELWTN